MSIQTERRIVKKTDTNVENFVCGSRCLLRKAYKLENRVDETLAPNHEALGSLDMNWFLILLVEA